MKNLVISGIICFAVALVAGGTFEVLPDGAIRAGDAEFRVTHWDANWQNVCAQTEKTVTGKAVAGPDGVTVLDGMLMLSGGSMAIREEVTAGEGGNTLDYSCRLHAEAPVPTRQLALATMIPLHRTAGRTMKFDGKPNGFGATFDEKRWQLTFSRLKSVELPLESGTLLLEGDFSATLTDCRMFHGSTVSLRLNFTPSAGELREASFRCKMRFQPAASHALDLRSAMNMAFADKVAGDGKGGWTDQGPENDMSALPLKPLTVNGIRFEIVDPSANAGKSCIVLRSRQMPGMPGSAEITFQQPPRGRYLYLLHALAWAPETGNEIGEAACLLDSSEAVEKQTVVAPLACGRDVADFWMPKALPNALVAWRGGNPSAPTGLYLTRIDLTGEPLRKLSFTTRGNSNWLIVAATLSDLRVDPSAVRPVEITAGNDWLPIAETGSQVKPGSVLDFAPLVLDPPAGKYGRVVRRGAQLEFENRPGVPFRFYGGNIVYWTHYLKPEEADRLAGDFAALGYNILRLHLFDFDKAVIRDESGSRLRPDYQDKLDYLVAAMKKRGIYITLDIFGGRHIEAGVLADFPDRKIDAKDFKALLYLSEHAQRDYEQFAANLFSHVNPHTGIAWKDEPAIATVSLVNEGTIHSAATRNQFVHDLFRKRFAKWAAENRITLTPENDQFHWRRFLAELYGKTYDRLSRFLRETVGVKAPLTDQNYWSSVPLTLLRDRYDVVDNHFYWAHPVFPSGQFNSFPATVMNDSAIGRYAGGVSSLFISRIFGKPFTVTEWDYVNPNSYNVEGAFLTGAYAALQEWSGLCRFAYAVDPQLITRAKPKSYFNLAGDPVRLLSERAGILFFTRGDVKPAETAYPFLVSRNYIENPANGDTFSALPNRLGLIGKTGVVIGTPGEKMTLPGGSKALLTQEKAWTETALPFPCLMAGVPRESLEEMEQRGLLPKGGYDAERDIFVSATGEITLARQANQFRVVTPNSEGLVLKAGQSLAGTFARVENRQAFAAFLIASVDRLPLNRSKRLLILHLTDTKNSGMTFSDPELNSCTDPGKLPLLVRCGEAEMELTRDFTGGRLFAVGFDGTRLETVPFAVKDGKTRFPLKTRQGNRAVAAYELIAGEQ